MEHPEMTAVNEKIAQLRAEQVRLAKRVITEDVPPFSSSIVTGIDVSYTEDAAVGCAVVMNLGSRETIRTEQRTVECTTPYIPGYFFLREGPVLVELLRNLDETGPILIDGNGVLHPRRLGLASHLGVHLDLQTIGVAKKLLLGEMQPRQGNAARIIDGHDCIGVGLWLGKRKKPVYVSLGHRISLDTAVTVVEQASIDGYPEPLRRANSLSKEMIQNLR